VTELAGARKASEGVSKASESVPKASAGVPKVSADWLDLREPADAAARATDLVDLLRRRLDGESGQRFARRRLVIHDLGSGTGSMARWLAPLLPGRQHWVMYDRDPELLEYALTAAGSRKLAAHPGRPGDAGGAAVTVEFRERDITQLTADDLDSAAMITASALLDMFTADELERVVAACLDVGCPALLTLSVTGQVELTPPDPLDQAIAAAFNAHQRRTVAGRTLLGPDAAGVAAEAFARGGAGVTVRSSPWRLGPDQAGLAAEWLRGWLDAACEQQPELSGAAAEYASRRLAQLAAGQLRVTVHHQDLLAGCE
jgi:SAM-dependent methyltransferase